MEGAQNSAHTKMKEIQPIPQMKEKVSGQMGKQGKPEISNTGEITTTLRPGGTEMVFSDPRI